jgi:hypothetical protein
MSNFIFILTEGDHDAAFLYRILKTNGIKTHHLAIKDYPNPINNLFINELYSSKSEELNIEAVNSGFLPYRVMQEDDNFLCIYKTIGDKQEEKRVKFVKTINDFIATDTDEINVSDNSTFSILFFFDADKKGVNNRITQVKNELKEFFINGEIENISNKEVIIINNIKIGLYVFTETNINTGSLEDILITLMRKNNDDIFYEAERYLNIHERTTLFKGKLEYDGNTKKKVNGKKYNHKKSLIGTVGQLQMSGKSNTVCISDADYLTEEKIKTDDNCNEIFSFIRKVMV